MSITITGVKARAVTAPIKRPPVAASGQIKNAALVLVDLETDAGITGHCYLFCFMPAMLKPTIGCIEALNDLVANQPLAPANLDSMLRKRLTLLDTYGMLGQALAAIDMCAWDALARSQKLPLASLLGGSVGSVRAYSSCGLWIQDVDKLADEAEELLNDGQFSALKLRLGRPDMQDDLTAVRNVKQRIGSDIKLMCDFNQSLSVSEAMQRCRLLDDEGLYWIEEPIRNDDYAGCAQIASSIDTPLQIGENLLSHFEMQKAIDAGAGSFYMPDVQRIGGVTGWMKAASLAHSHDLDLSSHLFPEISAHLLRVSPTCHWLEYVDWSDAIIQQPLEVKNGYAELSDRPGNGIEWDEDAVARYLFD
ncbi:MAG: mandelate racemase [Parasphingorhabdus sp.]|jgi:mandelate racemase